MRIVIGKEYLKAAFGGSKIGFFTDDGQDISDQIICSGVEIIVNPDDFVIVKMKVHPKSIEIIKANAFQVDIIENMIKTNNIDDLDNIAKELGFKTT